MPKLLSRSKHEEFELNSALQIKSQKERRAENRRKWSIAKILESCENFAICEISQVAKFASRGTVHPAALFTSPVTIHLLFDTLAVCYNFRFF